MTDDHEPSSGVHIGPVSGGIHGSIIAGRDVTHATVTIGGQPTPADKFPTFDEFKQLLTEIHEELETTASQQDALKAVSPAAPYTTQGAVQSVKDVVEKVKPKMQPEEVTSVQKRLTETTSFLTSLLDGAKELAEKAGEFGTAARPIVERLEPLVEKVAVAALWVAKLWP
jgi:hypothetical protein